MAVSRIDGGAKLTAYLEDLAKKVAKPGTLEVGFLEGATYPDGTSVPMVAAIQEFGAPEAKVPPRPYFRPMVKAKSEEWGPALAHQLKATDYDVDKSLGRVGLGIEGQLRQSIVDTMAPPLRPITLMLRKMKQENPDLVVTGTVVAEAARRVAAGISSAGVSTKPLVETGHLLNSIDSRVKT